MFNPTARSRHRRMVTAPVERIDIPEEATHQWSTHEISVILSLIARQVHTNPDPLHLPTLFNANVSGSRNPERDLHPGEIHRKVNEILQTRPAFRKALLGHRAKRMTRTLSKIYARGLDFTGDIDEKVVTRERTTNSAGTGSNAMPVGVKENGTHAAGKVDLEGWGGVTAEAVEGNAAADADLEGWGGQTTDANPNIPPLNFDDAGWGGLSNAAASNTIGTEAIDAGWGGQTVTNPLEAASFESAGAVWGDVGQKVSVHEENDPAVGFDANPREDASNGPLVPSAVVKRDTFPSDNGWGIAADVGPTRDLQGDAMELDIAWGGEGASEPVEHDPTWSSWGAAESNTIAAREIECDPAWGCSDHAIPTSDHTAITTTQEPSPQDLSKGELPVARTTLEDVDRTTMRVIDTSTVDVTNDHDNGEMVKLQRPLGLFVTNDELDYDDETGMGEGQPDHTTCVSGGPPGVDTAPSPELVVFDDPVTPAAIEHSVHMSSDDLLQEQKVAVDGPIIVGSDSHVQSEEDMAARETRMDISRFVN